MEEIKFQDKQVAGNVLLLALLEQYIEEITALTGKTKQQVIYEILSKYDKKLKELGKAG